MGSNGNTLASIVFSSSGAMLKLSIMYLVGILSAKYPKQDPILPIASLRNISRLSNLVLLPCLIISSLGSTITVTVIGRIGIMAFFCFVVNFLSYLLTEYVGYFIFGTEQGSRQCALFVAIKIAVGNPNAISLPIIVMKTMCANPLINADYENDAALCYNEATSMISVYVSTWFIMFWGYGFPLLQALKQQLEANDTENDVIAAGTSTSNSTGLWQQYLEPCHKVFIDPATQAYFLDKVKKIVFNPVIISVAVGLFIGLVTPLRQQLFTMNGSLYVIGSAFNTMAEAVVALNCFIMAASLSHCDFPLDQFAWLGKLEYFLFDDVYSSEKSKKENTMEEAVVQSYLYHPVSNPLLNTDNSNTTCTTTNNDLETNQMPSSTLPVPPPIISTPTMRVRKSSIGSVRSDEEVEDAINLSIPADSILPVESNHHHHHNNCHQSHQDKPKELQNQDEDEEDAITKPTEEVKAAVTLPPLRAVATLVICRLILIPLVMVIINQICLSIGILSPSNRMMSLLIILESAAPSAQVLIVTLNQLGIPQVASAMSYMYVYLYFFSIFTVTIWISVAMSLYY